MKTEQGLSIGTGAFVSTLGKLLPRDLRDKTNNDILMYILWMINQKLFLYIKLLVEKFRYCQNEPNNQDWIKLPKGSKGKD